MSNDLYLELRKRINKLRTIKDINEINVELNSLYIFIEMFNNDKSQKVCSGCPDRYTGCHMDWYQDVKDFNEQVIGRKFPDLPQIQKDEKLITLGINLVNEEINELIEACKNQDLVKIADAGADSVVVILGLMQTYGIDLRPVWDEVHKTNMAKKGGYFREDGKFMKPKDWKAPDIFNILKEQKENNIWN